MKQIDLRLRKALDELRTIAQSGIGVSLRESEDGRKGEVILVLSGCFNVRAQ